MPEKSSAIFKRLDQFNKRPNVQDSQRRQPEAAPEQNTALKEVTATEPEQRDQPSPSTEIIERQPFSEVDPHPQVTNEDFSAKAEHPPPEPVVFSTANAVRPVESANQTERKSVPAPRSLSNKRRDVTRSVPSPDSSATTKLDELVRKWKEDFRLHSGEIKVLRALYGLTHGLGSNECVTTQEKLAEAANLQRRQCINNVNTLEKMGFIERVEVYNEKGQRGIKLRFNLMPRPRSY
jgi:hypothetical protein